MTKKRTVGRPREGDSEKTRGAILEAAEECFARYGFVGATTRKVARGAAINVATLHYHFGNKEGLYRAVLEKAAARPPTPDAGETGGTAAEKVAGIVSALYDAGKARPSLARLRLLDFLAGPPAGGPREAAEDSRMALIRKTLTALNGSSAGPGLPPAVAARWIVTLIDGALLAEPSGGRAGDDPSRSAVIAAALKVSGLA